MANVATTEGELKLQAILESIKGKTVSNVGAIFIQGPMSAICIHFTDGSNIVVNDHYHYSYGFMVKHADKNSFNIHGQAQLGLISQQQYETELKIIAGQEALKAQEKAKMEKIARQKLYEKLKQEFEKGEDNGT